ncbi:uncharacterized protein FA14DRAFT_162443 [Meira miltonrushii]|uniref:CRAL-TRIO domain-containing protein n=1 Tax=Meira miltonrushii TaxID=1280837 RepID=A0A316V425_9BASI|nr:uncharacterized protein FA14DRAFT_162443 [Meira miltonrushii]PWN32270.1 hypothetical protein FA14DRAFT_162443 [Meira miltonrushii]
MPVAAPSAAAKAVAAKYEDIATKYNDHQEDVDKLQKAALEEVLPAVLTEVGLQDDPQASKHVRQFLKDRGLVFRFLRRSRYSTSTALDMLTATLTWRLRTDLDSLSLSSLHPLYASPPNRPPLFWCNTQSFDLYGRPLGVISLQSLERVTHDKGQAGLDECREYIVGCMESVRRYLAVQYAQSVQNTGSRKIDIDRVRELRRQDGENADVKNRPPPLQMVIVFSLASSGMANLEMELLPFLLDLLKNHFPGMVGAVYILHFGWVHSGMWAIAKRVLPQQALARIFFPNSKELAEHFDLKRLPVALGGEQDIEMSGETNDVMKKYARTHWLTRSSRSGSQTDLSKRSEQKENGQLNGNDEDAEDEDDLDNLESNSAPPSPKYRSGTSTPALQSSRTPRSLSRVGSFDSLMDEFHSVTNSPKLSRNATPRHSRPTTPHAEMSGYHFTMAFPTTEGGESAGSTSTLRLPPSAVNKLHRLQMTRGHDARLRTISDAANIHDLGGGERSSASASPIISRNASPERRRQRRRTMTGQSGRGSRNVRFEGGGGQDSNSEATETEFTHKGIPIKRVGSLRDFRLLENDLAGVDDGILDTSDSNSVNSDEESSKSGKAGHKGSADKEASASRTRRFFSLWRRGTQPATTPKDAEKKKVESVEKQGETEEEEDGDLTLLPPEPIAPDSPRLQVPDIEEPPLSELTGTFSRRSRLYGSLPGHVSPYNKANPFYGYPAYPVNASGSGTTATENDPRKRYQFRRRKRDLVRTLIYLFVLRLLALHRHVRSALLSSYRLAIRAVAVGGRTPEEEDLTQTQQYKRYQSLRSASTRFLSDRDRRESQETVSAIQKPKPKPQPLVALGFRKRYAVLMIIIAFTLLRNEWRSRRRRY